MVQAEDIKSAAIECVLGATTGRHRQQNYLRRWADIWSPQQARAQPEGQEQAEGAEAVADVGGAAVAEPEELLRQLDEVSAELARREAQLETEPEPEPEPVTVRAAVHQVQWWEPTPVLISRAGDRSDGTAVKGVGAPDKQAAVYRHLRAIKEL
jgi:hypothetical protein